MKKLLLLLLIIPIFSFGQKENNNSRTIYFNGEIGQKYFHEYTVGNRDFKCISQMVAMTPLELTVYLAHDFNNKNTLSLGVSIYDAFLQGGKITPLIIDYKHYFKEEDNSLFANAGIGYTLFSPSDINSMVFKIGLGYRFSISKSKRIHIGINYDFNKLYDIFTFENNSSFSSKTVDVNVYAFNVKIGIGF